MSWCCFSLRTKEDSAVAPTSPQPTRKAVSEASVAKNDSSITATHGLYDDRQFQGPSTLVKIHKAKDIVWKRPPQLSSKPEFMTDGASQFDVKQGQLGNCWVLAAIAPLSQRKQLLQKVLGRQDFEHGPDGEAYRGKFKFNFYQYGKWVYVEIDDRLPTMNNKLLYSCSSTNDEYWGALLEKAYAKLNGSYNNLMGGHASEALTDMTGGLIEYLEYNYEGKETLEGDVLNRCFTKIVNSLQEGAMVTTSIQARGEGQIEEVKDDGLVVGHAYPIMSYKKHVADGLFGEKTTILFQLFNPWGYMEWTGPFSDGSDDWGDNPPPKKDDGSFWIPVKEWAKRFTKVEICHLNADNFADAEGHWNEETEHSEWSTAKGTAGGNVNDPDSYLTNPYHVVTLTGGEESDEVLVSLQQMNRRSQGKKMLSVSLAIFKIVNDDRLHAEHSYENLCHLLGRETGDPLKNCYYIGEYKRLRDYTASVNLPKGNFAIIPSTFYKNADCGFYIRIFTEKAGRVPNEDSELVR